MNKGRCGELEVTQLVRLELGGVRGPTCVLRTSVLHYGPRLLKSHQMAAPSVAWAFGSTAPGREAAGQTLDLLPGVGETDLKEHNLQENQKKQLDSFSPS